MPMPPQQIVEIDDFPGLAGAVDARDTPPGVADEQVNCCSIYIGELTIRQGLKEVSFD